MTRPARLEHPFDAAVWERAVPQETFAWLRKHEPVSWWNDLEGRRGVWLISRHADVVAVTRDPQRFSSRFGVVDLDDHAADALDARRTMLEEDPPRHTAIRHLLGDLFVPRAVRAYERIIEATTDALLDAIVGGEQFDWVSAVATRVPIRVLCQLLGVPDDQADDLVRWGNQLMAPGPSTPGSEPTNSAVGDQRLLPFGNPVALNVFAVADRLAADRRRRPADDATSALVNGLVEGQPLSDEEFRATWLMLVIAGNETTRHVLSHAVDLLCDRADIVERWQQAGADGDLAWIERATEELIRWATPINWHRRQVMVDTELHGQRLHVGDKLIVSFTSANRDERVFTDPEAFDPERAHNPHVAFGRGGPHFCLGAHLARLEVRVVLTRLLRRFGTVDRRSAASRLASNHFNGLTQLDVALR